MYKKEINELIEILEESKLETLHYKDSKFELKLTKETKKDAQHAPVQVVSTQESVIKEETVDAPLVGVFYSRPSEDQVPYVTLGAHVQEGDILCIIEAMKVMNEIKAPKSGTIEKIYLSDGEAVSYGDALYKIV